MSNFTKLVNRVNFDQHIKLVNQVLNSIGINYFFSSKLLFI